MNQSINGDVQVGDAAGAVDERRRGRLAARPGPAPVRRRGPPLEAFRPDAARVSGRRFGQGAGPQARPPPQEAAAGPRSQGPASGSGQPHAPPPR